jgi:hypothetical protein
LNSLPPRSTRSGSATVDTRQQGVGRLGARATIELAVAGRANVPATANAAVINVTAVNPTDRGFLTLHQCDQPPPTTSILNYAQSVNRANEVLAALDADGTVCITSVANVDHVVVVSTLHFSAAVNGGNEVFVDPVSTPKNLCLRASTPDPHHARPDRSGEKRALIRPYVAVSHLGPAP